MSDKVASPTSGFMSQVSRVDWMRRTSSRMGSHNAALLSMPGRRASARMVGTMLASENSGSLHRNTRCSRRRRLGPTPRAGPEGRGGEAPTWRAGGKSTVTPYSRRSRSLVVKDPSCDSISWEGCRHKLEVSRGAAKISTHLRVPSCTVAPPGRVPSCIVALGGAPRERRRCPARPPRAPKGPCCPCSSGSPP